MGEEAKVYRAHGTDLRVASSAIGGLTSGVDRGTAVPIVVQLAVSGLVKEMDR
jgi:hypothetical protein